MTEPATLQALFGGTFDPVHYGHLRPVETLAARLGLQKITLLPNNVPPIALSRKPLRPSA